MTSVLRATMEVVDKLSVEQFAASVKKNLILYSGEKNKSGRAEAWSQVGEELITNFRTFSEERQAELGKFLNVNYL